jgi:hypothetical protein
MTLIEIELSCLSLPFSYTISNYGSTLNERDLSDFYKSSLCDTTFIELDLSISISSTNNY